MGIIDEVKGYLKYRKQQSVSPSAPERVDYYEYPSSGSPSETESLSESASPSAEYRPSVALSENVRYSDLTNPNHYYSPNHTGHHTMMSDTTSFVIRDPVFNTETERLPRPVKVKKSPVVKISNERQNRKLDNDK